jgi:hypothetical protein
VTLGIKLHPSKDCPRPNFLVLLHHLFKFWVLAQDWTIPPLHLLIHLCLIFLPFYFFENSLGHISLRSWLVVCSTFPFLNLCNQISLKIWNSFPTKISAILVQIFFEASPSLSLFSLWSLSLPKPSPTPRSLPGPIPLPAWWQRPELERPRKP